jgi:hypothetical protein
LVYRFTKNEIPGGAGGFGGDWLAVGRFNLTNRLAESVITKNGFRVPPPYTRGWVSQLLGVISGDTAILCCCGFQGPEGGKVHYWACSIDLHAKQITLLTRLEGVWF